ncbi:MAG TPA: ABC transporter substrate-binding protein [Streptosporangiaceae bacterium]
MRPQVTLAALAAVVLLAAGCARSGSTGTHPSVHSRAPQAASGSFGNLKNVCGHGTPSGAPDQGVTASQIEAGVFTDIGFTKIPDLVNAAKVFTSWCNAAGGINGRKIVADIRDTKLFNVVPQMIGACQTDFVLAGGSAAFDGLGVKNRLSCLLPDFPAQVVEPQNNGSSLQAYVLNNGYSYAPYAGYYNWLLNTAYPGSGKSVGILYGDEPITQIDSAQAAETLKAEGGTVTLKESFPVLGISNWTPYAEALKSHGVKGLVFYGEPNWLTSLEQALNGINYKLDWIDANSNAYGSLLGNSLAYPHNYADIDGYYPVEKASSNPATQQLIKLFNQYAPGSTVTLQVLQAFSSWLLFATSADTCGNDLTRKCVYEAAIKQTAWTGGGLQAPVNLAKPDSPPNCFNVEVSSPTGWQPAPIQPNNGIYRCGPPFYKYKGNYPKPLTLADVGKSMSNLK